ncbi:tetratricopeptide repeat protein [Actinoplanes sp. CA-030573]|uniref:tetratricopeptide repeat protein n=1 Tax=Actinoplanes sp. CA-030573 TaxID=3239898 RepID=UPI003D8CA261
MRRTLTRLALAAALAATALAVAGIVARPHAAPSEEPVPVGQPVDVLADRVARAQQHLRDVPGDWTGWAGLGAAYLEQARVTADPALYPQAEQAARESLKLRHDGNGDALVVLGALANARHDFGAARDRARAALRIDEADADAYGVLADALTQLGDAKGATAAVQRMLDTRPGLAAYARASYDLELRGRIPEAAALMRRALDDAADPHDAAFCHTQLGDLAFGRGDLTTAGDEYASGLAADPASVAAQRGRARVRAAEGDLTGAIADYADLTARLPGPSYLLEYAELLTAAGHPAQAKEQLSLAGNAQRLFTANGGRDELATAALALAEGRPADAVAAARAEWSRRRHPDVADMLAWSLHAAGHDAEALTYARRAVSGGAHPATYAYHLGLINLAQGNRSAARAELRRALDTNPYFSPVDGPAARRALSGLGGAR